MMGMTWLLKRGKGVFARSLPDATESIKGGATILVYYCAQLLGAAQIAGYRKTLIGYFTLPGLDVRDRHKDGTKVE
jgi:hypothetical protein